MPPGIRFLECRLDGRAAGADLIEVIAPQLIEGARCYCAACSGAVRIVQQSGFAEEVASHECGEIFGHIALEELDTDDAPRHQEKR